ncbi:MAG TPA: cobyric acid synthase, partial [Pyrinomonadaceae bacterium]|nr:cobyric acid synthase [Pyrinomonadaceae bacterium]
IGRAQAMQAQAAGIEPHVDMNPILLKPTSDVGSQVILNGRMFGNYRGVDYYELKQRLLEVVSAAYERLAARHEIIVLEGAGSPVEMNLKDRDVVNLKMAEIANASCVLVADIDRGGVFASLIGTYSLLEPAERARFCGFLINKFRGDLSLFTDGVDYLEQKLDQPCLGVIPYLHNHGIDDEDSVSLERRAVKPVANGKKLTVCVVGFPYLANFTDFTALEQQPDVVVYYTRRPDEARLADVLILPGSKNTISDLLWLQQNGWTRTIEEHVAAGKPLLGICGGFQMLGLEIRDPYGTEGDVKVAQGLGALDVKTVLAPEKITRQASASFYDASLPESDNPPRFAGYEIHLGETSLGEGVRPLFRLQRAGDDEVICDGAVACDGKILGTYLHGLFDSADGLAWILNHWRRLLGKHSTSTVIDPKAERERRYDALADHFRQHLNLDLIYRALRERRP